MLLEKVWNRIHIDYTISFLETNWLALIDAPTLNIPAYTQLPLHPPGQPEAAGEGLGLLWKLLNFFLG